MNFKINKSLEIDNNSPKSLIKKLFYKIFVYLQNLKKQFINIRRSKELKGDKVFIKIDDDNYFLNTKNKLQRDIYIYNSFESHLNNIFYSLIKADTIVVDVGANVGILSVKFANILKKKQLKDDGIVVGFEPSRRTFEDLNFNVNLNKDQKHVKIDIFNLGVGNKKEIKSFYEFRDLEKQHSFSFLKNDIFENSEDKDLIKYNVNITSLDSFLLEKYKKPISLIKIDIGGDELDVLKGAINIIKNYSPSLVFEYDLKRIEYLKIKDQEFNFLFDFGYQVFLILKNGFLKQINSFEEARAFHGQFSEICCINFKLSS